MCRTGLIALLLTLVALGPVAAEPFDWRDLYHEAEALAASLVRATPAVPDIIAAPPTIDRRMALVPPEDGRLEVIVPPPRFTQR